MTILGVLQSIVGELVNLETAPYVAGVVGLGLFAFFWRWRHHSPKQRRLIATSLWLWLCIPASIALGAIFHFSGPEDLRGVTYAWPAAIGVLALSVLALVGSTTLLVLSKGARSNLAASGAGLIFAQLGAWLVSGCAIVGRCV